MGLDTHALSEPAWMTALQVLVANGVQVRAQAGSFTPTPLISHAILEHNRPGREGKPDHDWADGIVITPSHNPRRTAASSTTPPAARPTPT